MKRIAIIVSVLLVLLLLGGAAWYFLIFTKSQGPKTAAEMVPADTPVFLWLPHAAQSVEKFKGTPAYSMWMQPGVQDTLKKADSTDSSKTEEVKKALALVEPLWDCVKGEAFLALAEVSVDPEVNVEAVGGFQIGPDPAAFTAWTDKFKAAYPEVAFSPKNFPAQDYFAAEKTLDGKKITLCVAQWKDWVLVGAGEKSFQELLNRVHGGKPDPALCLAGQPTFVTQLGQQPQGFDTLAYFNPAPLLASFRTVMEKRAPGQGDVLKVYDGLGGTMATSTIEGPNFRDLILLDYPKAKRPDLGTSATPLKGSTTRFTNSQTLAYSARNADLVVTLAQLRAGGAEEKKKIDEGIATINQALSGIQLDLEKDIIPKIGPECAFILDWGAGKAYPDMTLAMEHKDQAMMHKLMDFLVLLATSMGQGKVPIQPGKIGDDPTYVLAIPMSPVTPAIWVGKDMFVFTSNGAGLEALVKQSGPGLTGTEPYKKLLSQTTVKSPIALAYLDAEQLMTYSHGALSGLLPMVGAMAGDPNLGKSMPPVDQFKPYLGRWLVVSEVDDSGMKTEGVFEKGHPAVDIAAGFLLVSDFAKSLAPLASKLTAPAPAAPEAPEDAQADAAVVLQDLVHLDDAITAWAKDKNKPQGTPIQWDDIVPYIQENAPVVVRMGLDPLGNAYVLGKVGPGQVVLAPATQEHFKGKVEDSFWGKFSWQPQGELPAP